MNYKENPHCLICNAAAHTEYLNLGDQPLANSYHKGQTLEKYPLRMRLCMQCWHSQLSVSVNPEAMFKHYLYVSDTSKTLTEYFNWTTDYILAQMPAAKNVLEIACNSGLLLEMFKKRGLTCVGIDPAENLRAMSADRDLDVYVDYWNQRSAAQIKQDRGDFDLILAFHVLPHVTDPNDFISACVNVLSDQGRIFIQTSQCDMFLNNEFDVIYHEHSSYFTGRSIRELAHRHGLFVSSIIKTDIHSKSFLFSLQRVACDETQLQELIAQETQQGIYTLEKYQNFARRAQDIKQKLLLGLNKFRNEGYALVGYGAAAKGATLLNFLDYKLDYIIDDNELKCGYLTPGQDIPIYTIDLLRSQDFHKICFVPLAWNFYREIKERISLVRDTQNDVFVRYFPDYQEDLT